MRQQHWNMRFCRVCGSGWPTEEDARGCESVHLPLCEQGDPDSLTLLLEASLRKRGYAVPFV